MHNKLLAHRGFWTQGLAKNSDLALAEAFARGHGVETDIRDAAGDLVISHDVARPPHLPLERLLALAAASTALRPPLALNIKADGLSSLLATALRDYAALDCFVFDMAVPDMRGYFEAGIPVFTRVSDVELQPVWLERCAGVWLDAFASEWYGAQQVLDLLQAGKRVCAVSPELHGRPYAALWQELKPVFDHPQFMLCTDYPDKALAYFSGN